MEARRHGEGAALPDTSRDALLFFAGIYEPEDEAAERSFGIVTHPASEAFQSIHDRIPLMPDPHCWEAWLDPALEERAEIRATVHPLDSERSFDS